jgi:hypothetical protein
MTYSSQNTDSSRIWTSLISGSSSSDGLGTAWRWIAAIYLGLISSSFSPVTSQPSAARIGRDDLVDWMSVAAIPARDWALRRNIDRRYRGRHRISPMGRLLLGAGLLWSSRKVDRQSRSRLPRHRCCALGHPDLVARMIPGTFVSVLAANLYVAAAVLDRLPGSSLVGIHVPAFRLASSLAF